jgi:serologically defined colon cancer antigen 8
MLLFWQAFIECEQLKNELERQTERLEKELASQQEKRAFEKEMRKREINKEREDAESKVLKALSCHPHRRRMCWCQ